MLVSATLSSCFLQEFYFEDFCQDNDVSQVAPVPVVQEKPIQHASTSKVSNTTVQAHTAKSTGNHSRSPEVKPNVTKNAKKTVKVPLATEEPKKPRAKKDSFASLGGK